jgi:hypothetical protein
MSTLQHMQALSLGGCLSVLRIQERHGTGQGGAGPDGGSTPAGPSAAQAVEMNPQRERART